MYKLSAVKVVRHKLRRLRKKAAKLFHVSAPPVRCDLLRHVAIAAGGKVNTRQLGRDYQYSLPTRGSASVMAWLDQFSQVRFNEEICCQFPSGRVVGPGVILSPDGSTVARDVSIDFGASAETHWLLRRKGIPVARQLNGDVASVATRSGDTYYHWLLEELPRFVAAVARGHDTIIGHSKLFGSLPEALGFRGKLIDAGAGHHYRCERLTVESLHGMTGNPTPEVVEIIRGVGARMSGPSLRLGERIFISRANAAVRRLTNEDLIWPKLQALGFRRLILEAMPWHEQIEAFSQARVVVAPHGAGLANLAFCTRDARVVELFHPRYMNLCFWQLAAVCKLDYRPVVGSGTGPLRNDPGHKTSDISVDWAMIAAALGD